MIFMILNNLLILWFWQLFFQRFENVRDWRFVDLCILWSVNATAFGIANAFFGSSGDLAQAVAEGDLDYYIALPPPTLPHALLTRTRVGAIGDIIFGLVLGGIVLRDSPAAFLVLMGVCIPAALVFLSVVVLGASLGFFIGESRGITFQLSSLLISLGTYPDAIFGGGMRWVLYTIVPAAFFAHLPAQVVRDLVHGTGSFWGPLGLLLFGSGVLVALAFTFFNFGLRRYQSGNRIGLLT
jgi:ABC-2 type transport system permease protein